MNVGQIIENDLLVVDHDLVKTKMAADFVECSLIDLDDDSTISPSRKFNRIETGYENDADDETSTLRSFGSNASLSESVGQLENNDVFDGETTVPVDTSSGYTPPEEGRTPHKKHPKLASIGSTASTSSVSTSSTNSDQEDKQCRKRSAVDGLLFEIYERYHNRDWSKSIDSDNITECSTTSGSVYFASSLEHDETRNKLDKAYLETKGLFIVHKLEIT